MIEDFMMIVIGIAHIFALLAGAYHGFKSEYQEATFYIACALYFRMMAA
jgi:hypothetical protein